MLTVTAALDPKPEEKCMKTPTKSKNYEAASTAGQIAADPTSPGWDEENAARLRDKIRDTSHARSLAAACAFHGCARKFERGGAGSGAPSR